VGIELLRGTILDGAGGTGGGTVRPEPDDDHGVLFALEVDARGELVFCVEVRDGNLSLYPIRPGTVFDDVATE